jgi:glycosyltransferase involved in cell wall biosynthesis
LAEKIQYVLNNPEEAEEMGNKARQKCIEKYSWDAMEEILLKVFKKYE